jgi:hypothetical protein
MKHYRLDITLLDDVVFSVRPATQGDHECLDRVPGTALWGWAAAWLHRHHPHQAVALAHEGRLQFSDARPLSPSGTASWPTPLVWAADKGSAEPYVREDQLQGLALMNLSHPQANPEDFAQAKGLRGGYVSEYGELSHPQTRFRLKTAMNSQTGTVASGKLFGYDSLQAGQRFQARLSVSADADPAVVKALLEALGRHARLGRSRSGEYGRVRVSVESTKALPAPHPQGDRLVLWLLSDALLRDAHGRPCLAPDPEVLGLPGARFMPQYSALRHRSYSPWNAHRNTYGVERQVLVAGSVLVFERPGQFFTPDELTRLQAGLGTERHHGLGEVYVNPPLLEAMQPGFSDRLAAPPQAATATSPADIAHKSSPLMAFLQRRSSGVEAGNAEALAQAWTDKVAAHLRSARRYKGMHPEQPLGPNTSQWGQLASELQGCKNQKELEEQVFVKVLGMADSRSAPASTQGRSGVHQGIRASEDWNVRASGDQHDTLGACLKRLLHDHLQAAQATEAASWRGALRSAVHACNEIRRRNLHLSASLSRSPQDAPAGGHRA